MKRWKRPVAWAMLYLMLTAVVLTGVAATMRASTDGPAPKAAAKAVQSAAADEPMVVTSTPVVRTALVRVALMRLRVKLLMAGERDKASKITQVLRNPDALEAVAEGICFRFAQEHPTGVPGDWVDQLTALVQWIIDHADEIIAFIEMIINLFAQNVYLPASGVAWQPPAVGPAYYLAC